MRSVTLIRPAVTGLLLVAVAHGTAAAQNGTGPLVMRSENSSALQVWIVDPESGLAAFYGGDLLAICRDEPGGHDLVDIQEVYDPQEMAKVFVEQGKDVGASLWDHAPPFVVPRLCQDILSRPGPMATGTANLTTSGRFPLSWTDPVGVTVYGMTARGTMSTPDGESLRVNGHWRCRGQGTDTHCTRGLVVNR